MLAEVLDRDGQQLSASQTWQQALADADHLADPARDLDRRDHPGPPPALPGPAHRRPPAGYRQEPSHRAQWLWRTLRAAELAGLDARQVLADAVGQRDLTGARDIAAVIDARIRRRIGALVPLPAPALVRRNSPTSPTPNAARTPRRSPR